MLECVAGGLPNKRIARRLGIAERTVGIGIRTKRTGRRPIFTVDHGELFGQQLFGSPGATEGPMSVTVLPRPELLREVPLPYRLQGLTGPHDSRRAGDGNDLRDINLFTPGDRLRRIDWRVTARRNSGSYGGPGTITDLTSSPDGTRAAFVRNHVELFEVELTAGATPVRRWKATVEAVQSFAYAPAGGFLLSLSRWEGDLWLADSSLP